MQTFLKHESVDGVYCACVSPSSMYLASVQHRASVFMLLHVQLPKLELTGTKEPVFQYWSNLCHWSPLKTRKPRQNIGVTTST